MARSTAVAWLRTLVVYVGIVAVAVILGSAAGNWYNRHRSDADATAYNAAVDDYLRSNVRGLAIGQPFPDIPLDAPDGSAARLVRDRMPSGGVVLFLASDCGTCFQTIEQLMSAVGKAKMAQRFVIVVDSNAAPVHEYLTSKGAAVPLFQDTQRTLVSNYGVTAFPAYFALDSELRIAKFGSASGVIDELVALASE